MFNGKEGISFLSLTVSQDEFLDVLTFDPTSEAISHIVATIVEFAFYANDILVKKDSLKKLAAYLKRIAPILKNMRREKANDYETFSHAIEDLNREVRDVKQLAQECIKKTRCVS